MTVAILKPKKVANKRKTLRKLRNAGYSFKTYITFLGWRKNRKQYDYKEHGD